MLHRQKLIAQLSKIDQSFLSNSDDIFRQIVQSWQQVLTDDQVPLLLSKKKWSLLVPQWQGLLAHSTNIIAQDHPYAVLAVDGSQIYYDKHQGPACYLLNVGSVLLQYGTIKSSVNLFSEPEIVVAQSGSDVQMSTDFVDLHREKKELEMMLQQAGNYQAHGEHKDFVCLLDGTIIFFQVGDQLSDMFTAYMDSMQKLYEQKILHGGYISFPKNKELVSIVRLAHAAYQEAELVRTESWQMFNDMDLARLYLQPGQRSVIFQSKAPITYAYPQHLKPHFCYMNVDHEIVRLEFPQWIACDETLVNRLCAVALDQAIKGRGYPVALFEAHEQAVVKAVDRSFFYELLKNLYRHKNQSYKFSNKSLKKAQVPI